MEHGIDGIDGVSEHWSASRDVGVMRTVKAMTSKELRDHEVHEVEVVVEQLQMMQLLLPNPVASGLWLE